MKLSAILQPLVEAGVDAATILKAVKAWEEQQNDALERRRANDRERQERRRHVKSRDVTVTVPSRAGVTRVEDITSNLEITGKKEENKKSAPVARRVAADDFKAELTAILDDERIEALCAVRRKKGATFTAHAGRLLSKALSACPDPRDAADEMVLRNWTGIKPEWLESKTQRATSPPRRDTYVDAMHRILEGRANGTENIFGTDGDAQRISADGKRQGTNVADIRGGLARRIIQGSG